MFDFHQKRKFKRILASPFVQLFIAVLLIMMGWSAYGRYQISAEMADRRAAMELEVAALEERKASLQTEVDYLSDERGIEAEMRRQFDVAKEGETVVVIVEEQSEPTSETIPLATSTNKERWYEFWR